MKNEQIKIKFNNGAQDYDNHRSQIIPLLNEYYTTAIELTEKFDNPKILDLGAGTGILTKLLHEKHPKSEITLIDISPEMLNLAKNKFEKITQFKYIEGDYLKIDFKEKYDIIISSLSIHHLNNKNKKELYKKIYDHLNIYGVFINADAVIGTTDKTTKMYKNKNESYLEEQLMPQEQKDIIKERRKLDDPATLEANLKWLNDIGYNNVDVFFKYYEHVVIYAEKNQ